MTDSAYTAVKAHININGVKIGESYFAKKLFLECDLSKIFEIVQILYPWEHWNSMKCDSAIFYDEYVDIL